ncbi:MAG: septum formation protein Maf [Endomicrobiales bacterium]|nr:septum formation protein Maf [Endomicrobiales bacterium]
MTARRNVRIILASASPRRSKLLEEWGVRFSVMPSRAGERTSLKKPSRIVETLARRKALWVAKKVGKGIIIGADTIVVLKGKIIGKPKDAKDAARILDALNGSYHKVYSGVCVVDASNMRAVTAHEVSRVKMRRLSADEISRFSRKHLDKAGAYAVQEKDDAFVERIEGDYFNVVGLPFKKLKLLLREFGVRLGRA